MINLEEIEKEFDQLNKEKERIIKEINEKINLVNSQKVFYIKEMGVLFTIGFYDCHHSVGGPFMSFNSKIENIKYKLGIKDVGFENYCCENFKLEIRSHFGSSKRMFFKNKEDAQKCLDWIESLIVMEKLIK